MCNFYLLCRDDKVTTSASAIFGDVIKTYSIDVPGQETIHTLLYSLDDFISTKMGVPHQPSFSISQDQFEVYLDEWKQRQ